MYRFLHFHVPAVANNEVMGACPNPGCSKKMRSCILANRSCILCGSMELDGWPLPWIHIGPKVQYERNTEKQNWWYLLCLRWICNSGDESNTVFKCHVLSCKFLHVIIFVTGCVTRRTKAFRRTANGKNKGKAAPMISAFLFFNLPLFKTVRVLFFTNIFWNKTELWTDFPNCFSIQLTYFIQMSYLPERSISIFEAGRLLKKICIFKYTYMHIYTHINIYLYAYKYSEILRPTWEWGILILPELFLLTQSNSDFFTVLSFVLF